MATTKLPGDGSDRCLPRASLQAFALLTATLLLSIQPPALAAVVWSHRTLALDSTLVGRIAASAGEDLVVFAGGGENPETSTRVVHMVNTTAGALSGTWQSPGPLPHPHFGSSTLGGFLPDLSLSFFSGDAPTGLPTTVDMLDTRSMSWLPPLRTRLTAEFSACGGVASTVVCAGGQGHIKSDKAVPFATDVFTLSPEGGVLNHDTSYSLRVARKKLSAASSGNLIGFAMGFSDDASTRGYSDAYDVYNTATAEWTSGTLPSAEGRQYGTGVGCGGKLIWAGGQVQGGRSAAVDILDTRTGEWSNTTLTHKRSNLAAACAGNRYAVFAGGQIPPQGAVECLDTITGEWTILDDLSIPRGWLAGAGTGRCAVFAGGSNKKLGGGNMVDIYCFASEEKEHRGPSPIQGDRDMGSRDTIASS